MYVCVHVCAYNRVFCVLACVCAGNAGFLGLKHDQEVGNYDGANLVQDRPSKMLESTTKGWREQYHWINLWSK